MAKKFKLMTIVENAIYIVIIILLCVGEKLLGTSYSGKYCIIFVCVKLNFVQKNCYMYQIFVKNVCVSNKIGKLFSEGDENT